MARFTNFATLSYSGGTLDSNTVTGEIVETLAMTKTAVVEDYSPGDTVTYVIAIVNSGTAAVNSLALTDNLGGYAFNTETLYPLAYTNGSVRYYVGGVLQAAPTVTAGPPLTITGITVPAGGNATLVYETTVTAYAPLGQETGITNTATLSGGGLTTAVTAEETVNMVARAELGIRKAISPSTVSENGQLSYTFTIENRGNVAATVADQAILTDTFDPRLNNLTVTADGTAWTEGVNYRYSAANGVFSSLPGQITVPAAAYSQNSDGTWTATPGTTTIVVTGTV